MKYPVLNSLISTLYINDVITHNKCITCLSSQNVNLFVC